MPQRRLLKRARRFFRLPFYKLTHSLVYLLTHSCTHAPPYSHSSLSVGAGKTRGRTEKGRGGSKEGHGVKVERDL